MSFHAVRGTKHKKKDRQKGREERMKINGGQVLGVMHKTHKILVLDNLWGAMRVTPS